MTLMLEGVTVPSNVINEFAAKFWKRVELRGDHWIFSGKARGGSLNYGVVRLPKSFNYGRKSVLAHRLSFFLTHGRWPINARHTCDIPLCIRPDHIIEGTQADNIRDAMERGRARNGNLKLNPEIWAAIKTSTESSSALSQKYGVHPAHIRKIRRGKVSVYRP